ncbi:MAG: hypothetical protein ACOVN9_04075, partial [Inhella sp.]
AAGAIAAERLDAPAPGTGDLSWGRRGLFGGWVALLHAQAPLARVSLARRSFAGLQCRVHLSPSFLQLVAQRVPL